MHKLVVTTPSDTSVRFERFLAAPRDHVFHLFTDAEMMKRWYGDPVHRVVDARSEPRKGGAYSLTWDGDDGKMTMSGTYLEFDRPAFIKSDEHWDPDWTGGVVFNDIEFRDENGGTHLVLTSTYASQGARDGAVEGASEGFAACLDMLEALLAETTHP